MQHALLVSDYADTTKIEGDCPSDQDNGPLPPKETDSDEDSDLDMPEAAEETGTSIEATAMGSVGLQPGGFCDGGGGVWRCMYGGLGGVGGCCGPRLAAVWELGDRGACMGQTSVNKSCLHPNTVVAGLQSGGFCGGGGYSTNSCSWKK